METIIDLNPRSLCCAEVNNIVVNGQEKLKDVRSFTQHVELLSHVPGLAQLYLIFQFFSSKILRSIRLMQRASEREEKRLSARRFQSDGSQFNDPIVASQITSA